MNEAKLRQLSLLEERPCNPLTEEVEQKALELLVQLLLAVLPTLGGGRRDDQDQA